MIYNNPISYANDITPELFARLADQKNFVALKESSGDVRRITDLHNTVGDRYAIFTGVGQSRAGGKHSRHRRLGGGHGHRVPGGEPVFLGADARRASGTRRGTIYRWFTPLLHLDVSTKFVQYIKLAVQETGLGKEWVRAPRLVLKGEERKRVLKIIHDGIAKRPKLPKRAKA